MRGRIPNRISVASRYVILPVGVLVLVSLGLLILNSNYLTRMKAIVRGWALSTAPQTELERSEILAEARRRVDLYEFQLQSRHLANGLVVNRTLDGVATGVCDSLLFSSLRYVALNKLQRVGDAKAAWEGIRNSRKIGGNLARHPLCSQPLSRDMMVGILVALSQSPSGAREIIGESIQRIADNDGYFDDGPAYLSYLTPGLLEAFRKLGQAHGLHADEVPGLFSLGFSTVEFNGLYLEGGFRSHLVALMVWLELETRGLYRQRGMVASHKSPTFEVSRALAALTRERIFDQRLEWVSQQLLESNKDNLFFRLLYLDASGSLTEAAALRLLKDLLAMPQFPRGALPMDCDRPADYLWQRDASEYGAGPVQCKVEYAGVDFLWLSAILLNKIETLQSLPDVAEPSMGTAPAGSISR